MDGDFAPLIELVALRKKYKFLLVIDDVSISMFDKCFGVLICVSRNYACFVSSRHMELCCVVKLEGEWQKH